MTRLERGALVGALALIWVVAIGCALVPAPIPPIVSDRAIGVTVRDPSGAAIVAAAGELVPDFGKPSPCAFEAAVGRLTCTHTAPGGAGINVTADGYHPGWARFETDPNLPDLILTPLKPPVAPLSRLQVQGRSLVRADGQPFVWRGATAFSVPRYVLQGREDEVHAELSRLAGEGYTGIRVLTFIDWEGRTVTPAQGLAVLPRVLELAGGHGLYVEAVIFAGTRATISHWSSAEWRDYAARVGAVCAANPACGLLEIANENYHSSQDPRLNDLGFLDGIWRAIPPIVMTSCGAGWSDEAVNFPGCGQFVTLHLGRGRDKWNRIRHMREMELVSSECVCWVLDNEHMGAGEVDSGSRSTDPSEHFSYAALARVFNVGSNFHYEDGIWEVGGIRPTQAVASLAFVDGSRIVPDSADVTFKNAGWHDSPVQTFRFGETGEQPNAAIRVFSGVGSHPFSVLLGVQGDPAIEWKNGYQPVRAIADRPGVRILEIRQ